jgi:hypothetical protein
MTHVGILFPIPISMVLLFQIKHFFGSYSKNYTCRFTVVHAFVDAGGQKLILIIFYLVLNEKLSDLIRSDLQSPIFFWFINQTR